MGAPAGSQGPGPIPDELLRALDLGRVRRAGSVLPGERQAVGIGEGTELAQLRPYQPGDDVRRLDPAATARTGIAHVRLQVPERQLATWLVVDASASMAFGTAERLKWDVAEGVATVIGRLATRRGGLLAVVTCGSEADVRMPPRGGRRAQVALGRALANGPAEDGHDGDGALAASLERLGRTARRACLVVVVSDLRGSRDWRRALAALGARHTLLAVEVRDPREASLPAIGHLSLVDPETGSHLRADSSDRRLRSRYEAAERAEREAVAADVRHAGAQHVVVYTSGSWLRELGRVLR